MKWTNGAMFFLAVAIAASGLAFTSMAPQAIGVARLVFWVALALFLAMVAMAIVTAVKRRRRPASTD